MANSDCFANQGKKCKVLTCMICNSRKCNFYKTHLQRKEDLEKYPPVDYKEIYNNRHRNDEVNKNE